MAKRPILSKKAVVKLLMMMPAYVHSDNCVDLGYAVAGTIPYFGVCMDSAGVSHSCVNKCGTNSLGIAVNCATDCQSMNFAFDTGICVQDFLKDIAIDTYYSCQNNNVQEWL